MNSTINTKLEELKLKYKNNLPEKIRLLERTWKELSAHYDLDLFNKLHRDVHSLCGSSATYGFNDISFSARELEVYLKNLIQQDIMIGTNEMDEINQLISNLKAKLPL